VSFQLEDGVAIYGGFAGNTTSTPGVRNVMAYPTILSGDIGQAGNNSDNSYSRCLCQRGQCDGDS